MIIYSAINIKLTAYNKNYINIINLIASILAIIFGLGFILFMVKLIRFLIQI